MTTRMSRLPKRMSKALLKDVIVLETALPIFYSLLLLPLGLFFPLCGWCLSLAFPNGNKTKIQVRVAVHTLSSRKGDTQPPTRMRGERSEGKPSAIKAREIKK